MTSERTSTFEILREQVAISLFLLLGSDMSTRQFCIPIRKVIRVDPRPSPVLLEPLKQLRNGLCSAPGPISNQTATCQ